MRWWAAPMCWSRRQAIDHWKAKGIDLSKDPPPAGRWAGSRALLPDSPGPRAGQIPGHHHPAGSVPARDRKGREGYRHSAHHQRQPGRRHHPRQRNHQAPLGRVAGRYRASPLPGQRRAELWGLCAQGRHPGARRRRQRLPGQGPERWQADPLSAQGSPPLSPRRTSSPATSPSTGPPAAKPTFAGWRVSGSASATPACAPWWKVSATTPANT
jgi:hypothetical protein